MDMGIGSTVGMATNIIGGIMQSAAASMENRAMMAAFQSELARQGRFRAQAFDQWSGNTQNMGREGATRDMDAGYQNRMGIYDSMQKPVAGNEARPNQGDDLVYQASARNHANLGKYGDWQNKQAIDLSHTQEGLNKITNFAGGIASIFPYRMYRAQHSQDELDFWGKMIQSIGNGGGQWMQSGAPPQGGMDSNNPGTWGGYMNPYGSQPDLSEMNGGTQTYAPLNTEIVY